MADPVLAGKKIAVLLESQYIAHEIRTYRQRFEGYGASVELMSRLWGNPTITFVSEVEDAGGTLKLEVEPDIPVRADRQLLAQALSNLLDNALKYGGTEEAKGTVVTVTAKSVDGKAVITVADTGSGIAPEDRTRVLDRFVRLDESRNKPGNGLGLSLVSSVMKLHGGSLTLEDAGPGLLAKLELPLLAEARSPA